MISLHLILQILKIPLQKHKNSKCELNTPLSDTENFQRLLCSNRPMNPTAPGPCRIGFACFSSSPRFHLLPFATPAAALDAVGRCGALQSSTLPCPAAARVQLVRQHPPFPRLLCSFSRPRSSFPSGDDRASCAARCSSIDGGFAGDEHPTRVCLPIPFPSHPAARNQTPKSLT